MICAYGIVLLVYGTVLLVSHGLLVAVGGYPCSTYEEVCPPAWQTWGGLCYTIITQKLSWFDALDGCRSMGGEMMVPRSQQENDFVQSMLAESIEDGHWIGCNDLEHEGVWNCSGDAGQLYKNWEPGEPNNNKDYKNGIDGDCVRMVPSGTWGDGPCHVPRRAVCKRDPIRNSKMSFQLQSWRLLASCLIGHVMGDVPVNSISACAVECLKEPGCLSFNVLHQGKIKICQLNNVARSDVNQDEFVKMTSPLCIYGEQ